MTQSDFRPRVVIWGADNYNTLGVLRSLSVADINVEFVCLGKKHGVTTASKYCNKYIITRTVEKSIQYMVDNYPIEENPAQRAVLIPGGDSASIGIAENFEILNKRFHLMCTTDPKVLIEVTNKNEMGRVAKQAGFLVPEAQEYSPGDTDVIVPFPAILKPIYVEGYTEFKTKILCTLEELNTFSKLLNTNNRYLLQQFIEKSHDIVIYGVRLPDGELKLAGCHTLERWSDDGGGSYGHLSPDIPEYLNPEALLKFFDIIDYHGEFSAEYGYRGGKAYFYEVNLRNDGFCHLAFQAGANLPLLWVQACLGLPQTAPYKITKSIVGINEIYDVINVWRHNISWKRYKSDKAEAEAFHFYDPQDLKPYKNMHRRMIWEIPFRAFLKRYRPYIVKLINKLGL